MVRAWWRAFAANGFIESDFTGAFASILGSGVAPEWDREHWPLVIRHVRTAHEARCRRAGKPTTADGAKCSKCGGGGGGLVPWPADVRGGTWRPPYRTGDVACTECVPGAKSFDKLEAKANEGEIRSAPGTLCDYEIKVDGAWAEHLAERQYAERMVLLASRETECLPAHKIVKRLAAGFTPPSRPR
ncbi:unnamed protein product [Gemmata massiliana]|uniref:Uncharacterized protein n=2 Tax=Gemmata massiliana TaxID=1210884 RepID=A0A6P2D955_9BACT|nr:unnamed protein product [Gemmata massiliana]